eukprot:9022366-Pyramimonas_sp.AAC.1
MMQNSWVVSHGSFCSSWIECVSANSARECSTVPMSAELRPVVPPNNAQVASKSDQRRPIAP